MSKQIEKKNMIDKNRLFRNFEPLVYFCALDIYFLFYYIMNYSMTRVPTE